MMDSSKVSEGFERIGEVVMMIVRREDRGEGDEIGEGSECSGECCWSGDDMVGSTKADIYSKKALLAAIETNNTCWLATNLVLWLRKLDYKTLFWQRAKPKRTPGWLSNGNGRTPGVTVSWVWQQIKPRGEQNPFGARTFQQWPLLRVARGGKGVEMMP